MNIRIFSYSSNWRLPHKKRYLSCFTKTHVPKKCKEISFKGKNVISIKEFEELRQRIKNDIKLIEFLVKEKTILKTKAEEICEMLQLKFRVTRHFHDNVFIIFDNLIDKNCFSKTDVYNYYIPYVEFIDEKGELYYKEPFSNIYSLIAEILSIGFFDYEMSESVKFKGVFYHLINKDYFLNSIKIAGRTGRFITLKNEIDNIEEEYFVYDKS